jgi:hypothetical protein
MAKARYPDPVELEKYLLQIQDLFPFLRDKNSV